MANLYELTKTYSKLEDLQTDEELKEYLDAVECQIEEKAKGIFHFMANYKAFEDGIDYEIKRLQELKKSHHSQNKRLKEYLSKNMLENNIEKIETDIVKFSFRKSSTLATNMDELDSKYIITKTTQQPDKLKIKRDLKQGETIKGASLEEHKNLQIK